MATPRWRTNLQQINHLWRGFSPVQKGALSALALGSLLLLAALVWRPTLSAPLVPLFPVNQKENVNLAAIRSYLERAGIPYKMQGEHNLLVPRGEVQHLRNEIAESGALPANKQDGYELFDSMTWIRGEKELQVLELRAIKGQIERDLMRFDNIRSASVILDIPPSRPFGHSGLQPKASVLLTLVPGSRLSQQEIAAISFHVAGAVKGLTPNMIAISDTTGHLYQAIEASGTGGFDAIRQSEISLEEQIKSKVDGFLSNIVGPENFYTTVQVTLNRERTSQERKIYSGKVEGVELGNPVVISVRESKDEQGPNEVKLPWLLSQKLQLKPPVENQNQQEDISQVKQMAVPMDYIKTNSSPGKVQSLSIGAIINRDVLTGEGSAAERDQLRQQISEQLATIIKGYQAEGEQTVSFLPFTKTQSPIYSSSFPLTIETKEPAASNLQTAVTPWFLWSAALITALSALLFLLFSILKRGEPSNASPISTADSNVRLQELAALLERRVQQDPLAAAHTLKQWLREDKVSNEEKEG